MRTPTATPRAFDSRRLRGLLAERQITHTAFAHACDLSRSFTSTVLSGQRQPGELALIKIERGIRALGLDCESEVRRAG